MTDLSKAARQAEKARKELAALRATLDELAALRTALAPADSTVRVESARGYVAFDAAGRCDHCRSAAGRK